MGRRSQDLKGRQMSNKKPVPGYIWLLAGLTIGLFAAFLVYLAKQPADDLSFTEAVKQELNKARQKDSEKSRPASQQKPAKEKSEDGNSKPRFEFYTILSELEVFVPEPEAETHSSPSRQSQAEPAPGTTLSSSKQYLLQAGSFRNRTDAEGLKANLALLGVQSSIQSVQINADTWHRVRIGPFSNPARLRDTLSTLKQNNIHAMTMELK